MNIIWTGQSLKAKVGSYKTAELCSCCSSSLSADNLVKISTAEEQILSHCMVLKSKRLGKHNLLVWGDVV